MQTGTSFARPPTVMVVLGLVTLVVYWRVTQHGFVVYDDLEYVRQNPHVQGGLTLRGLAWAFTTFHASNWHPLTWLSHMLDGALFGLNAGGHHLTSLLLHTANSLFLFHVLRRMTGALWPSAFVAALFAWHPLHVESVAWIAERKDVLSGLFWMLTLLAWLRYVEQPGAARYATALGLFALGLMAKPMVVTLPCVLLLLDWWPLRRMAPPPGTRAAAGSMDEIRTTQHAPRRFRELVVEKLPFFVLAFASCVITFLAQHAGRAVMPLTEQFNVGFRVANALCAYLAYLGKAILPTRLAVFYPLPEAHPGWLVALAAIVLAGLTLLAVRETRTRPHFLVGWLWFWGTLVPVIGLVQVGDQALADRYTYLPLIGLGLALGWEAATLAAQQPSWLRAIQAAGAAAVVFWLLLTGTQVGHWKNSRTLMEHTLAVTGRNYLAETEVGNALVAEGKLAEARRLFTRALERRPTYPKAHFGLGDVTVAEGRPADALPHYERALQLNPRLVDARNALGGALAQLKRYDEAAAQFTAALQLDPAFSEAQFNLARTREFQGRLKEALAGYRRVLELRPTDIDAPTRMAWILATAPDAALRSGPDAVALAARVCEATRYRDALSLSCLAAALAETGRFSEATQAAQQALALAQAAGQTNAAALSRDILQQVQAGKPFREPAR